MKRWIILIITVLIMTSCADSMVVEIDGKRVVVEPYGLFNEGAKKDSRVIYQASVGNVICSIIFCETVIIPVWLIGWQLYEPYSVDPNYVNRERRTQKMHNERE